LMTKLGEPPAMKTAEYPPTLESSLRAAGFWSDESSLNLGMCSPGTLRNRKSVVNDEEDVEGAVGWWKGS